MMSDEGFLRWRLDAFGKLLIAIRPTCRPDAIQPRRSSRIFSIMRSPIRATSALSGKPGSKIEGASGPADGHRIKASKPTR